MPFHGDGKKGLFRGEIRPPGQLVGERDGWFDFGEMPKEVM